MDFEIFFFMREFLETTATGAARWQRRDPRVTRGRRRILLDDRMRGVYLPAMTTSYRPVGTPESSVCPAGW
jgi:hypothetical protein